MKMPWSNRQGPMKLLAISATVLLIALGMCGLQAAVISVLPKGGDFAVGPLLIVGYGELAAMLLSIVGIVLAFLWLLVKTIASSFGRRSR